MTFNPVTTAPATRILTALGLALCMPSIAHAELAPPLRAMLDSAIASGNDADIDTIAKYLKKASPDDASEIDKLIADHHAQIAAAQQAKLAHETFLQGWKGDGQIGLSQSSGNSDTLDVSAGLSLTKEGLHWRNSLHALIDYQRSNGVTSGDQIALGYEPDYKINDRLFFYGLAQYDRDRFAGYSSRETLGGGVGYRFLTTSRFTLDIKAGPAWRKTDYIGAPSDSAIALYGEVDTATKLSPSISLTGNTSVVYTSQNTTITSTPALTAKLNAALSAQIGYQMMYNSNPPPGFKTTDTLTRFSLVYGF